MKNTMSDRASIEKSFNVLLQNFSSSVLPLIIVLVLNFRVWNLFSSGYCEDPSYLFSKKCYLKFTSDMPTIKCKPHAKFKYLHFYKQLMEPTLHFSEQISIMLVTIALVEFQS
jgi:hypothetical protein